MARDKMPPMRQLLCAAQSVLEASGVPSAKLDCELLMAEAIGCSRLELLLRRDDAICEIAAEKFLVMICERSRRRPLQHIIGSVDFRDLKLAVSEKFLIPRPETEELVDLFAAKFSGTAAGSILDLGTGSGAIAIALAKLFPDSQVTATDVCGEILSAAMENAKKNGTAWIRFIQSNWFGEIAGKFDAIVSNPPYLTEEEWENAQDEIRFFEPKSAFVAQNAGLSDIFAIIKLAPNFLTAGGFLALEIGESQRCAVENFAQTFFNGVHFAKDLCGRDRFVFLENARSAVNLSPNSP
jgi:release factor glutamine methyltransferase